jgi:lipid-A-disaccharide synthase
MLEAAERLQARREPIRFVLPLAGTLDAETVRPHLERAGIDVRLIEGGRAYDVVPLCDTVITASGTATLEVALMGVPMAVIYRVNWLTWQIMHRLITIDDIALVNIVAQRRVVKEFVQDAARPDSIAAETARILDDEDYRRKMVSGLATVANRMGEGDGPGRVAALIEEMLASTPAEDSVS